MSQDDLENSLHKIHDMIDEDYDRLTKDELTSCDFVLNQIERLTKFATDYQIYLNAKYNIKDKEN